jgi:Orn/Lys/Arg decarboxylase, major domain
LRSTSRWPPAATTGTSWAASCRGPRRWPPTSGVGYISRAADLAHGAGIPLIVDQAWGSHFGFDPDVPPAAISQGADAQVVSTHKTLAAFTQSALLLARPGFLDLDRLDEAVDALNTTSPSAAIYGSVDRMRRRMASEGEDLVAEAVRLAGLAQREIAAIEFERDMWAAGVRLELAGRDTLVPVVTVDDRAIDRLVSSIAASITECRADPHPPSREDFTRFRWRPPRNPCRARPQPTPAAAPGSRTDGHPTWTPSRSSEIGVSPALLRVPGPGLEPALLRPAARPAAPLRRRPAPAPDR